MTYGQLGDRLGLHGATPVRYALWPIQDLCIEKNWPALTSIVLSKTTGEPGLGFITRDKSLKEAHERVFSFRWDEHPIPFPSDFVRAGNETTVGASLRGAAVLSPGGLRPGESYSWESLGERFGFGADYLGAAGGMISRPKHGTLLVVTHPERGRSFDYDDYWDGRDLIYAGRGKIGDQKLAGQNRDLAENRHTVLVFEPDGSRRLRFIGRARCSEYWWTREPDQKSTLRRVLRYRLRFDSEVSPHVRASRREPRGQRPTRHRPRPFDPEAPPPAAPMPGRIGSTPEERAQLLEQANKGHHALVKGLAVQLVRAGWKDIGEVPGGLDLWATKDDRRVIFEAKTLRNANAAHQVRLAIAQLFEYRFLYGRPTDGLCLVVDAPVAEARVRLLDSLSIGLLVKDPRGLRPAGKSAPSVALANE